MFRNLTDRQKKIALAIAAAAGLALVAMLSRGRGAAAEPPAEDRQDVTAAGSAGEPPFGSTFADNGEAAAGLSNAITAGLGEVGLGLGEVGTALQDLPTRDEIASMVAAGQAATPSAPVTVRVVTQAAKPKQQAAQPKPKLYAGHQLAYWRDPGKSRRKGKWQWPSRPGVFVHSRAFNG